MVHPSIGLITIFAIVLVPIYIFFIASFIGKPRAFKVTVLILGLPTALTLLSILFVWLLGAVLSLIVP